MDFKQIATQSGSVQLVDVMGSPLSVVNSARVSMGRRAEKMSDKDWRLIDYLWSHEHTSPFRHVQFQFHLSAPIFVLRQWMKHQVGCAWNEISGRYVEFDSKFWTPEAWRAQSSSVKQGSAGPMADDDALRAELIYSRAIEASHAAYQELLRAGVAKEQARAVLPMSLMSECYWTCSLHALIHFLRQRLDFHAQAEIRAYAEAVRESVEQVEGMSRLLASTL
jgi:thymidylate synthase (FAD)